MRFDFRILLPCRLQNAFFFVYPDPGWTTTDIAAALPHPVAEQMRLLDDLLVLSMMVLIVISVLEIVSIHVPPMCGH